jgi:hypothetical protein
MKKYWIKKGLMFFAFFTAMLLLVAFVVMGLWNALLPALLGVKTITFIQALGILLLSKILFGGFRGGGSGSRRQWKMKLQEKMGSMTQEEKEKFQSEWKNRCGGRWNMQRPETTDINQ